MKRRHRIALTVASCATVSLGVAAAVPSAFAAETVDCGSYGSHATLTLQAGESIENDGRQYFFILDDGPIEGCLDAPDDTDWTFTLQRTKAFPDWTDVVTAPSGTTDKIIKLDAERGMYRFLVTAKDQGGQFTGGVTTEMNSK